MRITEKVNFPPEILTAHADGSLVLFVGAGASMGRPSSLPSFEGLAKKLADLAGVKFNAGVPLDQFIGAMPENFNTHARTKELIADPNSKHNSTHAAIVQVASAFGNFRVVTTNYDNHLAAAAAAASLPIPDTWTGPALPLGDAFVGLVHLHGSVLRPERELVLTDRDFGHAYLSDAWATRFLLKMFDKFTVLFIGYGHEDPVMRYLALGLPSNTKRYVLTDRPDDSKWEHLKIVTIGYPAPRRSHAALVSALQAWDRQARMGRLAHRSRMQDIIKSASSEIPSGEDYPLLGPVEQDYLESRLSTIEGAIDFASVASNVAWLRWAERLPEFQGLFSGDGDSDAARVLGDWFGKTFVADPALHGAGLQTVMRLGQRFVGSLITALTRHSDMLAEQDAAAGRRWKALLASSVDAYSAPPDLGMLLPYEPRDEGEDFVVLRAAVRPFVSLKTSWLMSGRDPASLPHAEVRWRTHEHVLTGHLQRATSVARAGDAELGLLLEEAVLSAYSLQTAYYGPDHFDALSHHRSSIAQHTEATYRDQDQFREPIDALIDALRDYGEKAAPVDPDLAERWWGFGHSLFRRLALHLVTRSPTRKDDDRLRWALDRELLYAFPEKHEVFRLLKAAVRGAGPEQRGRLLADALVGPAFDDDMPDLDKHVEYAKYNLIFWLTLVDPSWQAAADAFKELQDRNPSFGPRDFPDLDSVFTSATWGERFPFDLEDFIQLADTDPLDAVRRLVSIDYSERNFDEPSWDGALGLVRRVAEARVDLGISIWEPIEDVDCAPSRRDDLHRAIISGWEKAELGDGAERATTLVASQVALIESVHTITRFLVSQIRSSLDSPESTALATMRETATSIWSLHRDSFTYSGDGKPSFLSLNSWPGDLANFWILEVDRNWRQRRDEWSGLDETERRALSDLLAGSEASLHATRPAVAGLAFFLFKADEGFAREHVLPLFLERTTGAEAWSSFLYRPRYDDRMLGAGLLQGTLAAWDWLGDLDEGDLARQFHGLVASILSFAGITSAERQALLTRSVLAENGAYAADFAAAVSRFVEPGNGVDGGRVWELWLRDHARARLRGVPRDAGSEELENWANVAPLVGDHAREAMHMFHDRGIGLGAHHHAPDWPEGLLANDGPELVAHLAERVRNSSPTEFLLGYDVRTMITTLTESLGEAVCRPLRDAAVERGFVNA